VPNVTHIIGEKTAAEVNNNSKLLIKFEHRFDLRL